MPRKKGSKKKEPNIKVEVSAAVKKQPRRFQLGDGTWVGIGAPVVIQNRPPKSPIEIPEATPDQYLEIAERCPHLVKIISE